MYTSFQRHHREDLLCFTVLRSLNSGHAIRFDVLDKGITLETAMETIGDVGGESLHNTTVSVCHFAPIRVDISGIFLDLFFRGVVLENYDVPLVIRHSGLRSEWS